MPSAKTIRSRTTESNVVRFMKWSIRVNNRVMDRPVREAIRIIDAMVRKSHYLINKHPQHCDLIVNEARKVFSNGLIAAELKCALGFNTHRMQDFSINKHVLDLCCLRCSSNKDWNHAVKCICAEGKKLHLSKSRSKLEKEDNANEDSTNINKIVSNISKFLSNETSFEINQEV